MRKLNGVGRRIAGINNEALELIPRPQGPVVQIPSWLRLLEETSCKKDSVISIDISTGEVRWRYAVDSPMLANITATASDLVFTGTSHGEFIALDARTGKVLYDHPMGKSVAGGVLTYAIDGKQYVALESAMVSGFFGGQGPASFTVFALP